MAEQIVRSGSNPHDHQRHTRPPKIETAISNSTSRTSICRDNRDVVARPRGPHQRGATRRASRRISRTRARRRGALAPGSASTFSPTPSNSPHGGSRHRHVAPPSPDDHVRFEVADTGIGIEPDDLDADVRAVHPSRRLDNPPTWRQRPRTRDRQRAHRAHERHDHRPKPAATGQHLHLRVAAPPSRGQSVAANAALVLTRRHRVPSAHGRRPCDSGRSRATNEILRAVGAAHAAG